MANDFKGIRFPLSVLGDTSLKPLERLIVTEIINLDNGQGCFAGNKHISRSISLHRSAVSRCVSTLFKAKHIYMMEGLHNRALRSRLGGNKELSSGSVPFIWVRSSTWLDTGLTPNEKLLLILMTVNDYGYGCSLTNVELAKLHGCSVGVIKRVISQLAADNYISISGTTVNRVLEVIKSSDELGSDLHAEEPESPEHRSHTQNSDDELGSNLHKTVLNDDQLGSDLHKLGLYTQQLGLLAQQLGSYTQQNNLKNDAQLGSYTQQLGLLAQQLGSHTQQLGSHTQSNREDLIQDHLEDLLEDQLNLKKLRADTDNDIELKLIANDEGIGEEERSTLVKVEIVKSEKETIAISSPETVKTPETTKNIDLYSVSSIIPHMPESDLSPLEITVVSQPAHIEQITEKLKMNESTADTKTKKITRKKNNYKGVDLSLVPDVGENIDAAKSYIDFRASAKKPLTPRAFELACKHATSATEVCGCTIAEAFDITVDRGWQGVNPSWIKNHLASSGQATGGVSTTQYGKTIMPQKNFSEKEYTASSSADIDSLFNEQQSEPVVYQ